MFKVSVEVFSFNDLIYVLMLIILKLLLFFKIFRKDIFFWLNVVIFYYEWIEFKI